MSKDETTRTRVLNAVTAHKKTRQEVARVADVAPRTAAVHLEALVAKGEVKMAYEYDESKQPPVGRYVYWR